MVAKTRIQLNVPLEVRGWLQNVSCLPELKFLCSLICCPKSTLTKAEITLDDPKVKRVTVSSIGGRKSYFIQKTVYLVLGRLPLKIQFSRFMKKPNGCNQTASEVLDPTCHQKTPWRVCDKPPPWWDSWKKQLTAELPQERPDDQHQCRLVNVQGQKNESYSLVPAVHWSTTHLDGWLHVEGKRKTFVQVRKQISLNCRQPLLTGIPHHLVHQYCIN